jgi:hypothetical protein
MQELKRKYVVLTFNWVSVRDFLMRLADACTIHFIPHTYWINGSLLCIVGVGDTPYSFFLHTNLAILW